MDTSTYRARVIPLESTRPADDAHISSRVVVMVIRWYQRTLSPDHSPFVRWVFPYGYCRFNPTCSEYGQHAVLRYGVVRGLLKASWRVARCNPWSQGGEDAV